MKRRIPMKRVNPKRKREAFSRAYGSPQRVAWVKGHPCIVCGAIPSENAHTRTGGASRKADACWIVPLCKKHHAELHRHGINTFEITHGFALDVYAQIVDAQWQATQPVEVPDVGA